MTFITVLEPAESTVNSTTTPLGSSAVFTGTAENVIKYTAVTTSVFTDVPGTVSLQFSSDGTNWDSQTDFTISASQDFHRSEEVKNKFFRIVYTNNGTAQTVFRLQTIYNPYKAVTDSLNSLASGVSFQATATDAFFRLRVAEPTTLHESKLTNKDIEQVWDTKLEGTATGSISTDGGYYIMNVATTNDRIVRQTRRYYNYQPGKSLEALITGCLKISGTEANYVSKMGYFDDINDKTQDTNPQGNGFFFEWDGSVVNVVERTSVTGTQVDTKVAQSNWNIDTMDGSGPSGVVVDWSVRQIIGIEKEWLGVGSVLMFMVIGRELIPVHIFRHANGEGNNTTVPYTNRPSLPIRYELEATGASAAVMHQICSTVVSNGGFTPIGQIFSANMGSTGVSVNNETPLISLRLKSGARRSTLNPLLVSLTCTTNGFILVRIYKILSPTTDPLTGSSWVSVDSESDAEYDISATAVTLTNATLITSTYFNSRASAGDNILKDRVFCTSDIAGFTDYIVVTAETIDNANETLVASLTWQETN